MCLQCSHCCAVTYMSICVHAHSHFHINTLQPVTQCVERACVQTVIVSAGVKTYGDSVCRSGEPVFLWEERVYKGGDAEDGGFSLCTNRWHSTLLWLAIVTRTKTGPEARVFASQWNRKLEKKKGFFSLLVIFCLQAALSEEESKQSEMKNVLGSYKVKVSLSIRGKCALLYKKKLQITQGIHVFLYSVCSVKKK